MSMKTWLRGNAVQGAGVVATFSTGICAHRHMRALLGAAELRLKPSSADAQYIDCVVGWGEKPNTAQAQTYAREHGLPYLRLEDGFVRSVGLGVEGSPTYSIVQDDLGIYYDATRESRLERLLNGNGDEAALLKDPELLARAERCMDRLVAGQISKYNNTPVAPPTLPPSHGRKRVLIVDQTAGDMSLKLGALPPGGLQSMLETCRQEHPNAQLIVKTHPDVLRGKKRSALGCNPKQYPDVFFLTAPANPIALLHQVDHVCVATSQMGMEALLCGKSVTCFGAPFYAGWGLTDDRVATPRRVTSRSLAEVFAAAYLIYSQYVDPATGEAGTLEDVLEHMIRQRTMYACNGQALVCQGFSSWKHDFIRAYLRAPGHEPRFISKRKNISSKVQNEASMLVRWGSRDRLQKGSQPNTDLPLARMEDGFLRSPGLGSDLTVPASLVVDQRGIYYDPTQPSDLEHILQHTEFSVEELERAERLRQLVLTARVSKYNLGENGPIARAARPQQRVILVPGQVENDASIQLGCRDIRSNLELLAAVRKACPNDYIVYKPHPDVVTQNRPGQVHRAEAQALCDEIVTHVHIHHCLAAADEVHTMTSLVGFEGLLREKAVSTYGLPFYAGWGLTHDRHQLARRSRTLSLPALVAGALLRYPRYVHPETLEFITPEAVVHYLRTSGPGRAGLRKPRLLRQLERLSRAVWGTASAR